MHCYLIHASVNRSHDLTGSAVCILITCQQISQIVMPEITGKSVTYGKLQDLILIIFIVIVFHQESHIIQSLPLLHMAIQHQFIYSHILHFFLYFL